MINGCPITDDDDSLGIEHYGCLGHHMQVGVMYIVSMRTRTSIDLCIESISVVMGAYFKNKCVCLVKPCYILQC